jgi:hypothetical protein
MATLIHVIWMSFLIWYQKVLEGALYCCKPGSGCGFLLGTDCPVPRPYAGLVGWSVFFVGMFASAYVPARALRVPNNADWWLVALLGLPLCAVFLVVAAIVLFA